MNQRGLPHVFWHMHTHIRVYTHARAHKVFFKVSHLFSPMRGTEWNSLHFCFVYSGRQAVGLAQPRTQIPG